MTKNYYNVVVVGAGPAGTTAAYICAKNSFSVALIERGKFPGSKNMYGGVIPGKPLAEIIPAFWEEAPVERAITRDEIWFMDEKSAFKISYSDLGFARPPYNKFSTIRCRFDHWYAEKAVSAGAELLNATVVQDLIYEKTGLINSKVCGVILEDGTKIYCDVVVIAEGAIGDLTRKAGLLKKKQTASLALYVKEIYSLPPATIEERFNIKENEGVDIIIVGYPTPAMIGKGGIFTNKSSISLTIGGFLNQLISKNYRPYHLLRRLKKHSFVNRMLTGAERIEYQAHIIPKGNEKDMPAFCDDGVMVVGDALMMVGGQGTVFAIESGKYAAETILQVSARNDFSKQALLTYKNKLNQSYIMKNIMATRNAKKYYNKFPDADLLLTKALNRTAHEILTNEMKTTGEKRQEIIKEIKKLQSLGKSFVDIYRGIQNWRVL